MEPSRELILEAGLQPNAEQVLRQLQSQLPNGVYLSVVTAYSLDGRAVRNEVRKFVVLR